MSGITGKIDVKNKASQSVTLDFDNIAGFEDGSFDWGGGVKDKLNLHIGGTRAVSEEFRDIVGGQLNINKRDNDVEDILREMLTGKTGGNSKEDGDKSVGIDGVKLVSLTCDSFTIELDNGRSTDTMTFTGAYIANMIASLESGADLGDGQSRFSVVTGDKDIIGTGVISDLVGGQFNGAPDVTKVLGAALDANDGRVELLSLEADSFTVQVVNEGRGTVDTLLFKGENAVAAIESLNNGFINTTNKGDEFVFISAGETGVFGNPRGIDGAESGGPNDLGGQLNINNRANDIEELIALEAANDIGDVTVVDQGDSALITIDGREGSVDTIVYEYDIA